MLSRDDDDYGDSVYYEIGQEVDLVIKPKGRHVYSGVSSGVYYEISIWDAIPELEPCHMVLCCSTTSEELSNSIDPAPPMAKIRDRGLLSSMWNTIKIFIGIARR